MTSYVSVLKSLDADVIATLDTETICDLIVLLSQEKSKRLPKSPVTWLKEWRDQDRSQRVITYEISNDSGSVKIRCGEVEWESEIIGRQPLNFGPDCDKKYITKRRKRYAKEFKKELANLAVLYVKSKL